MNQFFRLVRPMLTFTLMGLVSMAGMAQSAQAPSKVEEIKPLAEKIANVEVMLENHFNTLRGSLYTEARGYDVENPGNNWQYQVYQFGGKKYAVGWMLFQDRDSKHFVTNFLFFKEKEPGKLSFISGETGVDGRLEKIMFVNAVKSLADPVVVLIGSQFVYAGQMDSSPSLMNYDPGESKIAAVEPQTERIIVSLQDPTGAASEKFFDWNDTAKRFMMNFTGKR
jgi:hypothetical protein